jgi:site-specific DNA recombinase
MTQPVYCAVYTRKSSDEGLEQDFNSLDAQREACEAYIQSQKSLSWKLLANRYDDGGYSGGNMDRPGLKALLRDIQDGRVHVVVVYKVDRLTRSLIDFAKLIDALDSRQASFVSVTQQFNTTTSMGRLTLNVLLSFAQFEREVTGERIRDKISASKKKGMWMGGIPPLGYTPRERTLSIDEEQALLVRSIFTLYLASGRISELKEELDRRGIATPARTSKAGVLAGNRPFSQGHLRKILQNPIYRGLISHKGTWHPGLHPPIIEQELWEAVQAKLQETLVNHRIRRHASTPLLLSRLIYDHLGTRVLTRGTKKSGRSYRYYSLERQRIPGSNDRGNRHINIPAQDIETIVLDSLIQCVAHDPEKSHALQCGSNADRMAVINVLLSRITVWPDHLELQLNHPIPGSTDETTHLSQPFDLAAYNQSFKFIIDKNPKPQGNQPALSIGNLILKANEWQSRLTSGHCDSVQSIAAEQNISGSYVTRVIYLSCLAPDLSLKLLRGEHPKDLTSRKLLAMLPLPESWESQRSLLGLT